MDGDVLHALADAVSNNTNHSLSRYAVESIQLTHFRNHADFFLDTQGQSIVLTGANGAGKTNILEALSLLSPGRGLRKAKLRAITNQQALPPAGWVIATQLSSQGNRVQIGTGLDMEAASERRVIKIDGQKAKSQTQLSNYLALIWQTPQMDGLFVGSASDRRRFWDRLVYNFDAEHAARVASYEQVMRERNRLLQDGVRDDAWLSALEGRMAEKAVAIAAARCYLLDRLNQAMVASDGSFPKAHLTLDGEVEQALQQGASATDVEADWCSRWAIERAVDAVAGRTRSGVHRTELTVVHLLKNQEAALCSTGEQKALLLSILLAHARARKEWQGAAPILLLDEVVAHLDAGRRKELFDEITMLGSQAWLTGTDAADFTGMDAVRVSV